MKKVTAALVLALAVIAASGCATLDQPQPVPSYIGGMF